MVNKAVAAAGLVLLTVGIAMTAVIMVIEEWVVVTLPGTPECDDKPLGNLGLYTATYDPACTPADSQYNLFGKTESSTTEFWPLFPAQAKYGGFTNDKLGVEAPEFESCEASFDLNNEDTAAFAAALGGTINVALTQGNLSLADEGVAGGQVAQVQGGFTEVDNAIESLFSTAFDGNVQKLINRLTVLFGGISLAVPTIDAQLELAVTDFSSANLNTNFSTPLDFTNAKLANLIDGDAEPFSPATTYASLNLTTVIESFPEQAHPALFALKAIMASVAGNRPLCAGDDVASCLALTNVAANNTDLVAIFPTKVVLDGIATDEDSRAALGLMNACLGAAVSDGANPSSATGQSCKASPVFSVLPENLNDSWLFCQVAGSIIQDLQALSAEECTAKATLELALPFLLPNLIEPLRPLAPNLVSAISRGATKNLTKTQVMEALMELGIPTDFTNPYGPCLKFDNCVSFLEFVATASVNLEPEAAESASLLSLVVGICVAQGATTFGSCTATVTTPAVLYPLQGFFYDVPEELPSSDLLALQAISESYEAQCVDDEEDARRIELAQVLVPISISAEAVAFLLAVAAVAVAKGPLSIAAGVLSLAGFALTLSALLLVRGAPVYQSVGGDEVVGEPYYSAGQAETFGLIAIATPLLAGISFIVAGLLNRGESDGTLTSKVENTY